MHRSHTFQLDKLVSVPYSKVYSIVCIYFHGEASLIATQDKDFGLGS